MVLDYAKLRRLVDVPLNSELLLPLLPLDDRVILPHMTVPVAIDSETSRAALLAARQTDGLLVLVPRIDGRYARLGTVAHIEESGRLPDGRQASVVRGLYRGVLNSADDRFHIVADAVRIPSIDRNGDEEEVPQ